MITKTVYICERCEKRFDSEIEARTCESYHRVPVSFQPCNLQDFIYVRMSDGKIIEYKKI